MIHDPYPADEFSRERCRPYPEMVDPDGKAYTIVDTNGVDWLPSRGFTDKSRGVIAVPLSLDALAVIRHELGHAKWSPREIAKIEFDVRVLQAVEDARINPGLARVGIPVTLSAAEWREIMQLIEGDLRRRDWRFVALRAIASIGTNLTAPLSELLARRSWKTHRKVAPLIRLASTRLEAVRSADVPVAPAEAAVEVARLLAGELGLEKPWHGDPFIGCTWGPAIIGEGMPGKGGSATRSGLLNALLSGGTAPGPGSMRIVHAPLVHRCVRDAGGGRSWVPSEEGSVPRYIHRFVTDQKIFRRPKRTPGGTVLIDTSASMGLKPADVDRLVQKTSRASLVAIYSGRGMEGELRVVARDGMRASDAGMAAFAGGNVVDEPALAWLARQPAPRVWVSDGQVTGVHDVPSPTIDARCRTICANAGIRRVEKVSDAASALQSMR